MNSSFCTPLCNCALDLTQIECTNQTVDTCCCVLSVTRTFMSTFTENCCGCCGKKNKYINNSISIIL